MKHKFELEHGGANLNVEAQEAFAAVTSAAQMARVLESVVWQLTARRGGT